MHERRAHVPPRAALALGQLALLARPPHRVASTRIKVSTASPRSGCPPSFDSFEEFEQLVERGIRTNSFEDYTYIWWDLRPHPKFGTIEIRICDAQTRLDAVAAIAALAQSIVASVAADFDEGRPLPVQPGDACRREQVACVAVRARRAAHRPRARHGADGARRRARPGGLVRARRQEARLRRELELVDALLERSGRADEQLRVYEETESLLAVAQRLSPSRPSPNLG